MRSSAVVSGLLSVLLLVLVAAQWAPLLTVDRDVGFDPTNATEPGNRHVIVATGRDYGDVKPLSGIFSGSGTSRMFVDVQVTRLH